MREQVGTDVHIDPITGAFAMDGIGRMVYSTDLKAVKEGKDNPFIKACEEFYAVRNKQNVPGQCETFHLE